MTIITLTEDYEKQKWFNERKWALSANKLLTTEKKEEVDGSNATTTATTTSATTTQAKSIYFPKTEDDVVDILRSTNEEHFCNTTPVASVAGGHESSNVALVSSNGAIILDLSNLNEISINKKKKNDNTTTNNDDNNSTEDKAVVTTVTVGAGVKIKALVEAVRDAKGALPVGTGGGIGVFGYVLNGGTSGYFGRR